MSTLNTILIDFKLTPGWGLARTLARATGEEWIIEQRQTNQFHGSPVANVWRMMWYFLFPLQVVLRRKRYRRIVAWQQFFGLNYAFWCRLLHLRRLPSREGMRRRDGLFPAFPFFWPGIALQ